MSGQAVLRVGKRGTLVIPAALRAELGLEEGTLLVAEVRLGGVFLRPAVAVPKVEVEAARILAEAGDSDAYADAQIAVRALGVDPARIPHRRPK